MRSTPQGSTAELCARRRTGKHGATFRPASAAAGASALLGRVQPSAEGHAARANFPATGGSTDTVPMAPKRGIESALMPAKAAASDATRSMRSRRGGTATSQAPQVTIVAALVVTNQSSRCAASDASPASGQPAAQPVTSSNPSRARSAASTAAEPPANRPVPCTNPRTPTTGGWV